MTTLTPEHIAEFEALAEAGIKPQHPGWCTESPGITSLELPFSSAWIYRRNTGSSYYYSLNDEWDFNSHCAAKLAAEHLLLHATESLWKPQVEALRSDRAALDANWSTVHKAYTDAVEKALGLDATAGVAEVREAIAVLRQRAEDAELIAWGLANALIEDKRMDFNRSAIIEFSDEDVDDHTDDGSRPWQLMVEDADGGYTGEPEWRMKSLRGIPVLTDAAREALRKAKEGSKP